MDHAVVTALAGNVAVLLAVCAVWNTAGFWTRKRRRLQPILSGLMLAGLCLIAMNAPLILPSGMLLDTRSILVSVTALLFGPVPLAIVAVTTAIFGASNFGVDTLPGLVVILTSALIGLAWRRWVYPKTVKRYWVNLLMMSVTVQAAALASTVLIPYPQGMAVFRALALPMLLVFPTATVILSQLLIHTQAYRIPYGRLERFEPQRTQGYECSQQLLQQMPDAFALQEISFDKHGRPLDCKFLSVNAAFEKMVGLSNADILGKAARDVLPDVVPAWLITCGNVVLTGEPAQLEYCAFATSQHYVISVYRTSPSQCAATFSNITNRVRAAEETSKSLLRLQSLINYSPSPIVIMDDKGRIMELSAAARRILGMPPDDRVKQEATRVAPPEIFKKVLYVLSQPKDAAPSLESIDVFEYDGGKRYFESRLFPIHAPSQDEKLFGYLAIDVTERIEVEHALKASEEKYSNYIKNAPYAVYIIDEQGRFLEANQATTAITGYAVEALLHMSFKDITPPVAFSDNAHRWKELQKAGHLNIEINYVHKSGLTRWWIIDAVKLSAKRYLCFASDTTNKKQAETELLHLSYHDYLTGLFNRRFFEMELKRFDIPRCLPLSVFFGDINGVKLVNDTFGHAEGDRLIIDCARVINDCCRVGDTVARVGGDEFGIIMPQTDSETALLILTKIQDALSALDSKANNGKYAHSVSLGFGIKRSEDEDVLQILHIAEGYMYQRKLLEHNSSHSAIIASIKATMIEKDHDTGKHAERLVELSKVVAKALKLSQADQDRLELLATLHDIGKVGISDYILTKPGKLSIEEWAEMKRHPEIGYRIAISTPELIPVAESILCHHERWDGGGYPQGLMGEKIPLLARILAIVDAYDAMTHDRPYQKAIPSAEAIAEITLKAGTQFDPQLVRIILDQKLAIALKAK